MRFNYSELLGAVVRLWERAREVETVRAGAATLRARWEIGRRIALVDHSANGRGLYGRRVIQRLAVDLQKKYGGGFGERNLLQMRRFHQAFRKDTLRPELSWSHCIRLLEIEDEHLRETLQERAIRDRWSVLEIARQVRLATIRRGGSIPEIARPQGEFHLYNVKTGSYGAWRPTRPLIDCGFHTWLDIPTPGVRGLKEGDTIRSLRKGSGYVFQRSEYHSSMTYLYVCRPYRLIDGDTIVVHMDLGFSIHQRQTLRLRDLDAPDAETREGRRAVACVRALLKGCKILVVQTRRNDL